MLNKNLTASFKLGASAVALFAIVGTTGAAFAAEDMETITVTGYRASLEKAMDIKKNALDASDSILAEDIAKFPDLNVSESLQRIPGVAIQRDAGEGREISVRGLGPQFTRVLINGIETLATTGGADASGGTNRGRNFDFNVFGSELFSGLTVHKSASAELEEGSLGATVDMRTARPFDYGKFVFSASGAAGYNDLAGTVNPRVSALVSDTFLGGHLGAMISASYSVRHTTEVGSSTGRWDVNKLTTDPATDALEPRLPRYDFYKNASKRLGIASTVQWQPDDNTLFTLSGLFADFDATRKEAYLEVTALGKLDTSAASNYEYDPIAGSVTTAHQVLSYATLNANKLRTENRFDYLDTKFEQLTLEGSHSFTNNFKINAFAGWSESHHRNPVQTTLMMDLAGVNGYTYDFRGDFAKQPQFTYGNANVVDAPTSTTMAANCTAVTAAGTCNNWYLSTVRIRPQFSFNSFRNVKLDFEYNAPHAITIKGGFDYKNYGYQSIELRSSDGTSTSLETVQSAPGVLSNTAYWGSTIGTAITTTPLSKFTSLVTMPDGTYAGKTPGSWLVPDFDASSSVYLNNIYAKHLGIEPAIGNNFTVRENDYGGWLQAGWDTEIYGIGVRGNAGGRYVLTEAQAVSWNMVNPTTYAQQAVKTVYHDFLPSVNVVVAPVDSFLVRLNLAQVMTRPDLKQMGGTYISVSGSSRSVNIGNPTLKPNRANTADVSLEWYYSKGGMISVAGFYKKIGSYIEAYSYSQAGSAAFALAFPGQTLAAGVLSTQMVAACGTPPVSGCSAAASWTFNEAINTPGGHLDGVEINWQQPFEFLPHPLDNFGFTGNATMVDSSVKTATSPTNVIGKVLVGQSHYSYNATLYYDDTVFQARMSAAYRGKYATRIPGSYNSIDVEGMQATFNLDASASYKLDENFMVTFDALNLTNQHQIQYVNNQTQSMYINHQTGTEFYVGVKYDY